MSERRLVDSEELIQWIEQERLRAGDRQLRESDPVARRALITYRGGLDLLQQDILSIVERILADS